MKPKALESKRDEKQGGVANGSQILIICRKARGWDLIVRTPRLTYFSKKKISVSRSWVLRADTMNPASSRARTTRAVAAHKRTVSGPKIGSSSR